MQSVPRTLMGTGVPWYFMGDELFLTHPGLGCAGEGAGSIPTTHSSYILSHIPLPLWAHTPGMDGAGSLPHHVIPLLLLLVATPALVVWVKTSLPTTPSGWVLYPPGWELWLPYPLPPDPLGGLCPGFTACPADPLRSGPVGFWRAGTERDLREPHITALGCEECHMPPPC